MKRSILSVLTWLPIIACNASPTEPTARPGVFEVDHPRMGLRATFERGRAAILPDGSDAAFEISAAAWGCAGALTPLAPVSPAANATQSGVSYAHAGIDEWYAVGPAGIEQGFTVHALPECARRGEPLRIRLKFSDAPGAIAEVDARGTSARLSVPGRRSLRYSDPYAVDARGKAYPLRISATDGLSLEVEAADAAMPLVIDPLVWGLEQKILANDFPEPSWASNDVFGSALAVSGQTLLIGTPGDSELGRAAGAVYAFARGAVIPGVGLNWAPLRKLRANEPKIGARFGSAIALTEGTAVIGAPDEGAAYVFVRTNGTWQQRARLVPSESTPGSQFGSAVALSSDTVVVGAPFAGAAYVFVKSGTSWSEQRRLRTTTAVARYGAAVAIWGDTLAVGSDDPNGGGVEWYTRTPGVWGSAASRLGSNVPRFGSALAMNSVLTAIGAYGGNGSVTLSNTSGAHVALVTLTARDGRDGDQFGRSVALDEDTLVVGAPGIDGAPGNGPCSNVPDSGAAYVFTSNGSTWSQQVKLTPHALLREELPPPPTCHPGVRFATSVATVGPSVIVGVPLYANFGISTPNLGVVNEFEYLATNATPCTNAAECVSGFCVEGVCCSAACNDPCLSCLAELKDPQHAINGNSVTGICGEVRRDTDPKNGCTSTGTFCGTGDECSGAGSCKAANPSGTPCSDPSAVCPTPTSAAAQTLCLNYTCTSLVVYDCKRGYLCKAGGCKTSCASNDDCDGSIGFTCKGGQCRVAAGLVGAPCASDVECASTHCIDGFCCESACDAECESCAVADREGLCSPIDDDPDAPPGACADGGAGGEGGMAGQGGSVAESGAGGDPSAGSAGTEPSEPGPIECVPACIEGMVCDHTTGECLDQFVTAACGCSVVGGSRENARPWSLIVLFGIIVAVRHSESTRRSRSPRRSPK